MITLVLGMNPGVDDTFAIILAVKSGLLDLRATTIYGGSVGFDQCALNALKTIKVIDPRGAILLRPGHRVGQQESVSRGWKTRS